MKNLLSTPFIALLVILGGITITTALATTTTISTYPYTITDSGNVTRFVIAPSGNVGIGVASNSPPGLLNVRQLVDNNLGGVVVQNNAGTSSFRFWVDTAKNGFLSSGAVTKIDFNATNGGTIFPNGNVGIGTTTVPALLTMKEVSTTNAGGILLYNPTQTGSLRLWEDASNNGFINTGSATAIAIKPTGVVYFPAGNVGIGTTTPTEKLDVAGNIHLTGNMTSTPTNELAITTTNSKDICIGSC